MDGDGGEKKDRLSFRVMYFRDLALLEAYKWKIHLVSHLESRTYGPFRIDHALNWVEIHKLSNRPAKRAKMSEKGMEAIIGQSFK